LYRVGQKKYSRRKVRAFVQASALYDLAAHNDRWAEMFTSENSDAFKERVDEQVGPSPNNLADIASSPGTLSKSARLITTRGRRILRIQLSVVKKIFISRERIYREVGRSGLQPLCRDESTSTCAEPL